MGQLAQPGGIGTENLGQGAHFRVHSPLVNFLYFNDNKITFDNST